MPSPRIFISSTCHDLKSVRYELGSFIELMGYESVMSENNDVLYDNSLHTHESCFHEVSNCDMVVAIISPRFGSSINSSLLGGVDINQLVKEIELESYSNYNHFLDSVLEKGYKPSITQAEIINAIWRKIPLYVFVDAMLMHDRLVYHANKDRLLHFPSLEKQDSAKHIFDFIGFIKEMSKGNAIYEYSTISDIRKTLTKQWAMLFRSLLNSRTENRIYIQEKDDFKSEIFKLKTFFLSSFEKDDATRKKINLSAKYYNLVLFILSFPDCDVRKILLESDDWCDLMKSLGVIGIKDMEDEDGYLLTRSRVYLIRINDYFRCGYPRKFIDKVENLFNEFSSMNHNDKTSVIDSLVNSIDIKESSLLLPFLNKFSSSYEVVCEGKGIS